MDYVTRDTVTDSLGANWAEKGDANLSVMLANAWLNEQGLTTFEGDIPSAVLMAGAQIAQEVVKGNMYQGRTDGVVVSKSVKAGSLATSKTYASGKDGEAISAGEQMALALIAPYKAVDRLVYNVEVY